MTDPSTPRVCRAPHPEHPHLSCLLYASHGGEHQRDWDGDRWVNLTWSDSTTERGGADEPELPCPDCGATGSEWHDGYTDAEQQIISWLQAIGDHKLTHPSLRDWINVPGGIVDSIKRGEHRA